MKYKNMLALLLISLFLCSCASTIHVDEGGIVGTGNETECSEEDAETDQCEGK